MDWKKLRHTVDEEIHRQIAENPDTAPKVSDFSGFRKVYNPPLPDVKALRCELKLSQEAFASRFGFSTRSVQRWEEGQAVPDRQSHILLRVIEKSPRAIERALEP